MLTQMELGRLKERRQGASLLSSIAAISANSYPKTSREQRMRLARTVGAALARPGTPTVCLTNEYRVSIHFSCSHIQANFVVYAHARVFFLDSEPNSC